MAIATAERERARGDIARLAHKGLGVGEFARAAARILRRVVPFDGACLLTTDPATLLPTGEMVENGLPPAAMVRFTEIELKEPDFNKFAALAQAPRPAASLGGATEGDLDRSLRQREVRRPNGFEDELRAVLADGTGTWGALTLLREAKRPLFTATEVRFMAAVAETLADGLRRAMVLGDATGDAAEAGLVVLAPDNTIELANRAADHWFGALAGNGRCGELPLVVHSVAARTWLAGDGVARARVRTDTGQWLVVRGSLLDTGDPPPVAILLEPAGTPELAPLIADAYGFTARERRLTELVARGYSTNEIAEQLHISAYTVQDHLKSIFEKSGTSSRGDLVARMFFEYYAPRLNAAPDTATDS